MCFLLLWKSFWNLRSGLGDRFQRWVIPATIGVEYSLLLLEMTEFRDWLKRVDIFIASHHGRESGFCEEVFNYCSPKLVIMSDKSEVETSCPDDYRPYVQGLLVTNAAGETRKRFVLTTRTDGAIFINIDPEGRG